MKILYVTTVSNTINAFLIPHIKFLIEKGHQVDVGCFINQKLKYELLDLKVKVYNIPFSRKPYSLSNLKAYKILRKIIKEEGYDIIHSHTPIASFISRLITRKSSSIKRIYTAHGFHFYKGAPLPNWLIYYPIEKYLSKYTDVLIAINQEDYEIAFKKMHAKKSILIHGIGIDFDKFNHDINFRMKRKELKIHPDTFVILSVGELNKNKNHQIMIKSLKHMRDKEFVYLICGEGKQLNSLMKLSNKLGLGNKICYLGLRSDINELLKIANLFVMPSLREGLPVSMMEALVSGTPIIGSDIRGVRDLLNHKQELMFNPKHSKEVIRLIDMQLKKPQKINNFDLEKFSLQNVLEKVYMITIRDNDEDH